MADNFKASVVELDNAEVLSGTADPTIAGVVAPKGSIYLRNDTSGSVYQKTGALNTEWDLLATGANMNSYDAFARLRVSNPGTIFDSKLIDDAQPLLWDDVQETGAGTASAHQANKAMVNLTVGNLTAGKRTRQSRRRFNYQPGKSQLMFITFVLGTGVAGITKRIGQFDDNNGLFVELDGTTLNVVCRASTSGVPVNVKVAQAAWNIDTMDGAGPSGITLDLTKTQILIMDYEWLGVGSVRFGWVIDGAVHYCHQQNNANNLDLVWSSNPNNPLRYQIENDGAGPAATLSCICSTVITEGGRAETGIQRSVDRGITGLVMNDNTSLFPLVSIRFQTGKSWVDVIMEAVNSIVSTNSNFRWAVLLNPTISGGALVFVPVANSGMAADVTATNALTITAGNEGTVLASGYATQNGGSQAGAIGGDFRPGSTIAGVSDIVVLAVGKFTGASETAFGSFGWRETN